ncbi:MAG: hypothetical protein LBT97_14020, partial [Planctomycetota bacterium]|nr:hypothetical protein [Planctomycetota bacterium]
MPDCAYAKLPRALLETLFRGDAHECGECLRNAFPRLAPFLLRGKAPRLKSETGTAHVLVSLKGKEPDSPLRDAVILPLRWQERTGGVSPLPPRLLEFSRQVAGDGELRELSGKAGPPGSWTLRPDFPYDIADWDEVVETWDSAWGALAGGLTLARLGLRTDPGVMISASWKNGALRVVGNAEAKARAAREVGVRRLYLSIIDRPDELSVFERDGFSIERLPFNCDLKRTFAGFFYGLGVAPRMADAPGDGGQYERCREYAEWIHPVADAAVRNEYQMENITPWKVKSVRYGETAGMRVDRLAVLASQASAALLSIGVFQPREVALLVSEREAKNGLMEKIQDRLGGVIPAGAPCSPAIRQQIVDVASPGDVEAAVAEWLEQPGRKVLDVTGTTKSASAAAAIRCAERLKDDEASIVAFATDNPQSGGGHLPG